MDPRTLPMEHLNSMSLRDSMSLRERGSRERSRSQDGLQSRHPQNTLEQGSKVFETSTAQQSYLERWSEHRLLGSVPGTLI
jgi:hypothetical protein